MKERDDRFYLLHMKECIANVEEDTRGDKDVFASNRTIRDAVMRNLQLLGESSKRVSAATQDAHPEIPWRDLADFRNVVVHDYLQIDVDEVWRIIANNLPPLKAQIDAALNLTRPHS